VGIMPDKTDVGRILIDGGLTAFSSLEIGYFMPLISMLQFLKKWILIRKLTM